MKTTMEVFPSSYRAGLGDENGIVLKSKTFQSQIREIKRMGHIDCRSKHTKQYISSEFREGAWGVFFWNRSNCALDAWIEWEPVKS